MSNVESTVQALTGGASSLQELQRKLALEPIQDMIDEIKGLPPKVNPLDQMLNDVKAVDERYYDIRLVPMSLDWHYRKLLVKEQRPELPKRTGLFA